MAKNKQNPTHLTPLPTDEQTRTTQRNNTWIKGGNRCDEDKEGKITKESLEANTPNASNTTKETKEKRKNKEK